MEREFEERTNKRLGTKTRNTPVCERCGRPVKISRDDYMRGEILCPHCAAEYKDSDTDDLETSSEWPD